MDERLRRNIDECYDGSAWEAVTGILRKGKAPFQIWKFEHDVWFEHKTYRCLIIENWVYDVRDISAIDYAKTIYEEAWEIATCERSESFKRRNKKMKYIVKVWSNSTHEREYETDSRSAMKAAEKYGRYECGEVVQVCNKSGVVLSEVRYTQEDGGKYY